VKQDWRGGVVPQRKGSGEGENKRIPKGVPRRSMELDWEPGRGANVTAVLEGEILQERK